ncbi:MAG: hypothetical protein HYR63_00335 [Proteobacteria bacterium]|nr:hypothetical protein [Pseudomonadota bacterium]
MGTRYREPSLVSLPPVPREGQLVLLCAVEEVLGRGTELGRYLTRAVATEDPLDLMQAQTAFDALPAELRQTIAGTVRERMRQDRQDEADELPPPSNLIRLRPRSAESPRSA